MPVKQQQWRSEVVETDDRFFVLRDQWHSLQQSLDDPQSSPFLSWDWMYLWWTIYRESNWQLAIGLIWCDERLVAVFPFYIKNVWFKELHFLGTGEAEQEEVATEYLDCLMESDADVRQYASQWLNEFLAKIDIVVFERMLASAVILSMLSESRLLPVRRQITCGRRYSLEIQNCDQKFSSNLKRKYRKYQKNRDQDQWQVERCDATSNLDYYLSELKRLHELRWQSKGKAGAFASLRFVDFHRRFAESMLKNHQLYLTLLRVHNEIVGCLYAVDGVKTRYFYQAGFLPSMQQWAPGHLGHFLAIDDAVAKEYSHYDLMLGAEVNSYKQEYVSAGSLMVSVVATTKKWKIFFYRIFAKYHIWRQVLSKDRLRGI